MKKYVQQSLMLSAIILIIVAFISFLCFEYSSDMLLIFLIVCIAFLCVAVHNIAAYIFYDSFLKEIICEYVFIELIVLGIGVLSGWFIKSNWWMSFIYVTPAFLLAYLLGIVHIKREIQSINERLHERGRKFEKRG